MCGGWQGACISNNDLDEEPRIQRKQKDESETKTPDKGNMSSTDKQKTPGGFKFAPLMTDQPILGIL